MSKRSTTWRTTTHVELNESNDKHHRTDETAFPQNSSTNEYLLGSTSPKVPYVVND